MILTFFRDRRGNYAMITAVAVVPIMGSLALAVDYTEMSKQRQETLNALDAAGTATGHRIAEGATDDQAKAYAKSFFEANLGSVDPADTVLHVTLPSTETGGGTLKLCADLTYQPFFYSSFKTLIAAGGSSDKNFSACSEVRLKNTLEVALVLDNSGSMDFTGTGSGKKRIDLLKSASKDLITTLVNEAALIKQVDKPVQFGLVPFAASVNVGSQNAGATWMDKDGISPVHHENFDWSTFTNTNKKVTLIGGAYYKKGTGWGAQENEKMTRFTLYKDLQRITGTHNETTCVGKKCTTTTVTDYAKDISWQGCVEARPYPYNVNDAAAASSTPATLFVPMFAPDETDLTDSSNRPANNNWWGDASISTASSKDRQKSWEKYYTPFAMNSKALGMDAGPNVSCSTKAITPLTDVSNSTGMKTITDAIDAMAPDGATNVPEGLAWGWRVVSHGAPFTEGRAETENGNDKVVIVLTDGANTYYTPDSVIANEYSGTNWSSGGNDLAITKALYSSYGYIKLWGGGDGRLFQGTSVSKTTYSNSNYTAALNAQMTTACDNAKAAGVILMTVSLDLSSTKTDEKTQMDALKACASESRFRKDPTTGKPAKLYWNATGGSLADKFKEIANELSNLRIVG